MRFELLAPVPAVSVARRLREIPLFRFVSVDELFRISAISQQARYEAGAVVQKRGERADYIQVLVSGRLLLEQSQGTFQSVEPPVMLGFQEALEGAPLRQGVQAETESIALVMVAEEFRGLLSANIELAQGLFRLLLNDNDNGSATMRQAREFVLEQKDKPLGNVDKVMYLQTLPILARATGEELYEVAALAREVNLHPGDVLFSKGDSPSIILTLDGSFELETEDGGRTALGPGTCLGIRETLAGAAFADTGRAVGPGKTLRIEREPFFDLLGDRMNLLQVIFGALFHRKDASRETMG